MKCPQPHLQITYSAVALSSVLLLFFSFLKGARTIFSVDRDRMTSGEPVLLFSEPCPTLHSPF